MHQDFSSLPVPYKIFTFWVILLVMFAILGKHQPYIRWTIQKPLNAIWRALGPRGQGMIIGGAIVAFLIWILMSRPH